MSDEAAPPRVNLGYAVAQLEKALAAGSPRADRWQEVIAGLAAGRLQVGSRTPVAATPAWVTLEVLHGGFASGALLAGGPLRPHELERLAGLADAASPTAGRERALLNLFYLTGPGLGELEALLASGRYRVEVPEEAALLVYAWLRRHGEQAAAEALLDAITPFMDRLRFYPAPHPRPLRLDDHLALETAGEAAARLRAARGRPAIDRMNEALAVWAPLADRAVALWLETVEGEAPHHPRDPAGTLARQASGQPVVAGGWPCRRYPPGWAARAQALLADHAEARARHGLCGKPERRKENYAALRGFLARAIEDPRALTGRDVGMIRKVLAAAVTAHGAPGGPRHAATRAMQARMAARPTHAAIARQLASRLEAYPADEGVRDTAALVAPLSPDEAAALGAAPGEPLPPSLATKAGRCLEAPLEALLERRLITSSEALAGVLPPLTARLRAQAIPPAELGRVYAATYVAFRRRRSLLLLDLERQVKLAELPWIGAVAPWIGAGDAERAAARAALTRGAAAALRAFPQTLLPNPLVAELNALAQAAGLAVPLVEELAADIFMGTFTSKYLRAGQAAARLLRGSLYERYYGLDYARVAALEAGSPEGRSARTAPAFAALCRELAGPSLDSASWIARNGMVLEQAQIVTTHNLAALFEALELADALPAGALARETFAWICLRARTTPTDRHGRLRAHKDTAYAWRQALFYLSLAGPAEVEAFLPWSEAHLGAQREETRQHLAPVIAGLRLAVAGGSFDADGRDPATGAQRLLGWGHAT